MRGKTKTSSGLFETTLIVVLSLSILLAGFYNKASAQTSSKGTISGQLVDSETGQPLIGASVVIVGTKTGTATDLDGNFIINKIPQGIYNLMVSSVGYTPKTIEQATVTPEGNLELNIALDKQYIKTGKITVTAKAVQNTEASLLKKRQRATSVSDAISAEAISKSGSSTAASAMTQVTGASVVGGKYVYVRGLGDRYSSTHMNGVELPSADPDKKAFQMDLLPSNLLDNIVTLKSFTPDKPGNFSGGIVDIGTRDYPDRLTLKFSMSGSYNTQATSNEKFLTYAGGGRDWLGMDDGARGIPEALQDESIAIPNTVEAWKNADKAYELDRLSNSFNSIMSPSRKSAPLNQSYSLSIGNQTALFERPLGYLGSFSYSRNYAFYDNGSVGSWRLPGNIDEATSLTNEYSFTDAKGSDEVLWGGLLTLSYKPHPNHEIASNFIYTQSGETTARYITGKFYDGNLSENSTFETRVLKYVERSVQSVQLRGQSYFKGLAGARLEWNSSYSRNTQEEPDLRFFSNDYAVSGTDTTYSIHPNLYKVPQRYFRNLDEDNINFDSKISVPFALGDNHPGTFKFGGSFMNKERIFRERIFEYHNIDYGSYNGNPAGFFSSGSVGIIDKTVDEFGDTLYTFGNYIVDASEDRSNYDGDQKVYAAFAMFDLTLTQKLRFIGGARFEATRMNVLTRDQSYAEGILDENDILPSVNIVYQFDDQKNLRAAYGRTIARPTLREMAPFPSYDFANSYFLIGNENLKRTLINNLDLRFEWFVRPGEIIAISGFYKRFNNPIERAIKNDNREIQFQNVDEAHLFGAELEARMNLDVIHRALRHFQLGGNLSVVHSRVDIPDFELLVIRESNPYADDTRPLQGQSPYIVNLNFAYENLGKGVAANLHYNVFGERLSEVSKGGTPDIYEQPMHTLDFNVSYRIITGLKFKASAKNILEASVEKVHHFKGEDYTYQSYKPGRTLSLGVSYEI
jgi:TonB-dependent receptor